MGESDENGRLLGPPTPPAAPTACCGCPVRLVWCCLPVRQRLALQKQAAVDALEQWTCRIQPSPNGQGVGLFALRDLAPGTLAFSYLPEDTVPLTKQEVEALRLPPAVALALDDLWFSSNETHWFVQQPPNHLSYAAALNHAAHPNLHMHYDYATNYWQYFTTCAVAAGEELTLDYRALVETYDASTAHPKYSDPNAFFGAVMEMDRRSSEADRR